MESIEAVIFDLDDTLLNRAETFLSFCKYMIDQMLYGYIAANEKESALLYMQQVDKNGYESRDVFYEKIINKWVLPYTVSQLENVWVDKFDTFSIPQDGLIKALTYLFLKYKLAIITNGSSSMQNRKINALEIRPYFQTILISDEVGIRKPDKEIFLLGCKSLGSAPTRTVYIGDNYHIDVVGATQAGLQAIWLNKNGAFEKHDYMIKDLLSVMTLL